MYLSRLILNPRNRRVQAEVAAPYEMHRTIMHAFPDALAQGEERVLFRLEPEPHPGGLTLLVQSLEQPNWSWLEDPKDAGYLLPIGMCGFGVKANPDTKPFDPQLAAGRPLSFRLRANPTIKRNGKRYGLYQEEHQICWLARKAEQGGFRLIAARTTNKDIARGRIYRTEATHPLQLLAVQFDGILQVTDSDRLRETIHQGIGSGKGFGFGLLSLAPAPA